MSNNNVSKNGKGNGVLPLVRHWLYCTYLYAFHIVFYREKEEGYFVRKRLWVFILLAPIIAPFFMLNGLLQYWNWSKTYYMTWVGGKKQKLTLKQKIAMTDRLLN